MATARKTASTKSTASATPKVEKAQSLTFGSAEIGQQISIGKINRIEVKNSTRIIHAINDAGFASNIEGEENSELV